MVALLAGGVGCRLAFSALVGLVLRQDSARRVGLQWEDLGATPLGEKGFTPQGMTWAEGRILFANTWKDERSRVYEFDPDGLKPLRWFDMPAEAVHTSGLTWDGKRLWGVDFKSNRAYCIDLELSLSAGEVAVIGSFDTTLRGTSACCFVPEGDEKLLAVSDFMKSRRTIFVRPDAALRAGTATGHIAFSYRNEGFSQGLEYIDGFLYESENKIGIDVVNKMDMARLRETGSARKATVAQYNGPSKGIEDLAWDGRGSIYTSDETSFRFYRARLAPKAADGE